MIRLHRVIRSQRRDYARWGILLTSPPSFLCWGGLAGSPIFVRRGWDSEGLVQGEFRQGTPTPIYRPIEKQQQYESLSQGYCEKIARPSRLSSLFGVLCRTERQMPSG